MNNRTTITFHSGLDTIGGVIMEIRYGNDRAFFEAGTSYNPAFDMFDGRVNVRKNFIADYLWLNEIPKINGIYRKEDIQDRYPDLIPAEEFPIDHQAFFITHMHLDHMRMMGMIAPDVTVYLSEPAQKLEQALEEVHEGVETIRGMHYTDMSDETDVGAIHVKRFIINDDSYQDYSFYIETPDLKFHHTGDVFVYGKYRDNILKEIEYLNEKQVDILSCEGTRFFSNMNPEDYISHPITPSFEPKDGLITKDELDRRITKKLSEYDGLVIFNYYEREMSDVMLFTEAAKTANRTIVYEPESAHLINRFFERPVTVMIPDTYEEAPDYLEDVLKYNSVITKAEVKAHPRKYLVQNTYPNMLELLDYKDVKTLYMHHSGIPLGDFDPKLKRMKALIEACHMEYTKTYFYEDGYFSPHAETFQILGYIEKVNAKLVIPCHSSNRKAMIANLRCPYYYCKEKETYVYDSENNTLEVVDYE